MEALLSAVRQLESQFYRVDTTQVEEDCEGEQ